ncbi:Transcription factor [Nymphaea thermarum]|nr:Transcription factor [Nymphaea thermarum]
MDAFELFYPDLGFPDLSDAPPSAFTVYSGARTSGPNPNHRNLNRRAIEMLRRIQTAAAGRRMLERSQGFRHMMSERQRRAKLEQEYRILHSMLPCGSKNDKVSIVREAARQLKILKRRKEELQRQAGAASHGPRFADRREEGEEEGREERSSLEIRAQRPVSVIDAAMKVAECLKGRRLRAMGLRAETIDSREVSVVVDVLAEDMKEAEKATRRLLDRRRQIARLEDLNFPWRRIDHRAAE